MWILVFSWKLKFVKGGSLICRVVFYSSKYGIFPDDHHHRNPQYEQKHNHTHSAPALDTTQVTTSGSIEETHPDGLDELRPIATTCNSVAAGPDSEHGTEMNPSEAESYTVIIRYDATRDFVVWKVTYWHA
jgi:hypothetical protein